MGMCLRRPSSTLERLVSALLQSLLDLPIAVARAGDQDGGDAGPAGWQGRTFRVEVKRYRDSRALNERELLGEIDQAVRHDGSIEAWILVTTREIPEQLARNLRAHGEKLGVPIVLLGRKRGAMGWLAVLCAASPAVTGEFLSDEAVALARSLRTAAMPDIRSLKLELQSWCIGFSELQKRSIKALTNIWESRAASLAAIGQDAAVGAEQKRVRRDAVHDDLSAWWGTEAARGALAAIVGGEGVGKTWVAVDWLHENRDGFPIVIIIPASHAVSLPNSSQLHVKHLMAERLREIAGTGSATYWSGRLDRLLERPARRGPVLAVLFDGLSQEPTVPWPQIFFVLQEQEFRGRIRILFTTRRLHWARELRELAGLDAPAVVVNVNEYGSAPGGELERMLGLEGLNRSQLQPDLLELVRRPRMFKLAMRFRARLKDLGQITAHRLLWEYGRDTLPEKAAFTESQWRGWLQEVARRYRGGLRRYRESDLRDTVGGVGQTPREVYARLSAIVEGQFAEVGDYGSHHLRKDIVAHALGMALLEHLTSGGSNYDVDCSSVLDAWLEPISGMDERAELLRAAVSILLESRPAHSKVASALVSSWLQTQNIPQDHRDELARLAPELITALLDTIEGSRAEAHRSAQFWAVHALRSSNSEAARAAIIERVARWFLVVSRDVLAYRHADAKSKAHRSARYLTRIGVDRAGPVQVFGRMVTLVDDDESDLKKAGVELLDGFPLAAALPVFEAAAISLSIRGDHVAWGALEWLCLLNEIDPKETREVLRRHSIFIRARSPEAGIHPDLSARVGALLLWLTGEEDDAIAAANVNPGTDKQLSYQRDYLDRPSLGMFMLERRHAVAVLNDTEVRMVSRARRVGDLWVDPTFSAPQAFNEEVRAYASGLKEEMLHRGVMRTRDDWDFEELLPTLARCAPDLLGKLVRQWLESLGASASATRWPAAVEGTRYILLLTSGVRAAARELRFAGNETNMNKEWFASYQFLTLGLVGRPFLEQAECLLESKARTMLLETSRILNEATAGDADRLWVRYGSGDPAQRRMLLLLFAQARVSFNADVRAWLEELAFGADADNSYLAYRALAQGLPLEFGRTLWVRKWRWSAAAHPWTNDYGSHALIEATKDAPFDRVAERFAPWRLLEAARRRGSNPGEVRLASRLLGRVFDVAVQPPEHSFKISVDTVRRGGGPLLFRAERYEDLRPSIEKVFRRDEEAEDAAFQEAVKAATQQVRDVRARGASLYLMDMASADLELLVQHAPEELERWLDGMDGRSPEFRRRVHLAEFSYVALCEVLLARSPSLGARLWRALRDCLMINFIGIAEVNMLVHIAFRSPDSPDVEMIREELLSLQNCHTDKDLMDLALAAVLNGQEAWLRRMIEQDKASGVTWRRYRGTVMEGFESSRSPSVEAAWPDGEALSEQQVLRRRTARRIYLDACAEHWWRVYLMATDPIEAHAAWILFLKASDRRAWRLMRGERGTLGQAEMLKWEQCQLNRDRIRSACKKREEKLESQFLGRDVAEGVGPWRKLRE